MTPLTDDQILEAWDLLAARWGVTPPTSEGQQAFTSALIGSFFAGIRYREFCEAQVQKPDLALPGFDFDPQSALRALSKKQGH